MTTVLDSWDSAAVKVLMEAMEESRRIDHVVVGECQLFVALVRNDGELGRMLRNFITVQQARKEMIETIGIGGGHVPIEIPFSKRASNIVYSAIGIAQQMGSSVVSPLHILYTFRAIGTDIYWISDIIDAAFR